MENRENWMDDSEGCHGLYFPRKTNSIALIKNVRVHEVVLPYEGEIEMRADGEIQCTGAQEGQCKLMAQKIRSLAQ